MEVSPCTIWISNLAPSIEQHHLAELFGCCGDVIECEISQQQHERCCQVTFTKPEMAQAAKLLNGTMLAEKAMKVIMSTDAMQHQQQQQQPIPAPLVPLAPLLPTPASSPSTSISSSSSSSSLSPVPTPSPLLLHSGAPHPQIGLATTSSSSSSSSSSSPTDVASATALATANAIAVQNANASANANANAIMMNLGMGVNMNMMMNNNNMMNGNIPRAPNEVAQAQLQQMQQTNPSDPFLTSRTVYIGNVSPHASESYIRDFFSSCGTVVATRISTGSNPMGMLGDSSRYCFVEFSDQLSAVQAMSMSGQIMVDRAIKVGKANAPITTHGKQVVPGQQLPQGVSALFDVSSAVTNLDIHKVDAAMAKVKAAQALITAKLNGADPLTLATLQAASILATATANATASANALTMLTQTNNSASGVATVATTGEGAEVSQTTESGSANASGSKSKKSRSRSRSRSSSRSRSRSRSKTRSRHSSSKSSRKKDRSRTRSRDRKKSSSSRSHRDRDRRSRSRSSSRSRHHSSSSSSSSRRRDRSRSRDRSRERERERDRERERRARSLSKERRKQAAILKRKTNNDHPGCVWDGFQWNPIVGQPLPPATATPTL